MGTSRECIWGTWFFMKDQAEKARMQPFSENPRDQIVTIKCSSAGSAKICLV